MPRPAVFYLSFVMAACTAAAFNPVTPPPRGAKPSSSSSSPSSSSSRHVFVRNLAWSTEEGALTEHFRSAGAVEACEVMRHGDTGRSKGWALVTFSTPAEAQQAIALMDQEELEGRALTVRADVLPQPRAAGSGFNKKKMEASSKKRKDLPTAPSLPPPPPPPRATSNGVVVRVSSFAEMEAAARRPEAKGILFERGPPESASELDRWVAKEPETPEAFSREQLLVGGASSNDNPGVLPSKRSGESDAMSEDDHDHAGHDHDHEEEKAGGGKGAVTGGCGDKSCADEHCSQQQQQQQQQQVAVRVSSSGPEDLGAACERLTRSLPLALGAPIKADAEALAAMLLRLCHHHHQQQQQQNGLWLTLQLEIVGKNSCSRWHQDKYLGRSIVTYNAPGTWLVDDSAVRYEAFQATVGQPKEVSEAATHLFTPNQIAKTNKWHLYLETKQKMEASDSNHLSVGGRGHLLKHEYFYAYV
jgi:hypothetical protein